MYNVYYGQCLFVAMFRVHFTLESVQNSNHILFCAVSEKCRSVLITQSSLMGGKGPEGGRYGPITYSKEVALKSCKECAVEICTCSK